MASPFFRCLRLPRFAQPVRTLGLPPVPPATARPGFQPGFLLHLVLVPALLIAAAVAAHSSGLDSFLTDQFFDHASGEFPWRSAPLLETIGHGLARSVVTVVWALTFAGALASHGIAELRPYRAFLWSAAVAMALGPIVVVVLKDFTSFPCPWNLREYGGFAERATSWFVSPGNAGRCFPSGHSAGGFSFIAFYFTALAMRRNRLAWALLAGTFLLGTAFSTVRLMQGAHFLSHAVWSAAIDWLAAAIVFIPWLTWLRSSPMPQTAAPAARVGVACEVGTR